MLNGASNKVLTTVPTGSVTGCDRDGVAVNSITNRIYVTNPCSDSMSVLDGATNAVLATLALPVASYPYLVAVNPTTNRVYVSNPPANTITVIQGVDGK